LSDTITTVAEGGGAEGWGWYFTNFTLQRRTVHTDSRDGQQERRQISVSHVTDGLFFLWWWRWRRR